MERASVAKLGMPKTQGIVLRERLFALLDSARSAKASWVAGEPGVGKTTLVASWLAIRRHHAVWYRVDEGDGDAASFFHYLSLGLAPHMRRRAGALPFLSPEYRSDLPAFTRRYMRDLLGKLAHPVVIVLDDFHRAAVDAPLSRCLVAALDEMGANTHLVIVGREAPRPDLARMVANRELIELEGADLRLTLHESQALLGAAGLNDEETVRRMHELVDGWTAGLVLLSARPAAPSHPLQRATQGQGARITFNYFAAEIFDQLTQELREVLTHTALFAYFTDAMARSITGNPEAPALLARLVRSNLFLSRLDGEPSVFQFHPLFRTFLLERLAESYALPRLKQLRSHAAGLLAGQLQVEDAIALYGQAGDWEAAAELVMLQASGLLSQGRAQTLQNRIAAIPNEIVRRTPKLLYWLGASFQSSQPAHARELFAQAFSLCDQTGDHAGALRAAAAAAECQVLEWSDMRGLDRWLPVFERTARRYPEFDSLEDELRVLTGMLAAFVYRRSQHPACAKLMVRAEALIAEHPGLNNQMLLGAVAYLRGWTGDFEKMDRVVAHMRALAAEPDVSPLTRIWWHCAHSYFATLKADFATALLAVEQAGRLATEENLHTMDATIALRGAMAANAGGDTALATSYVTSAGQLLNPHRHVDVCTHSRVLGWIQLRRGERAAAIVMLRRGVDAAARSGMEIVQASAATALAMALTQDGQYAEATELLLAVRSQPLTLASPFLRFSCAMAQAHLGREQGEFDAMDRHLREAFGLARMHGLWALTYTWHADIAARLCEEALGRGIEVGYVNSFIARHGLRAPDTAAHDWPWPVRVRCLGRFDITIDGVARQSEGKVARKPLELLQLLVAHGPQGAHATVLSGLMWPDAEGDAAQNSLNQALHRLRRLIGRDDSLRVSDGRLLLDAGLAWVDSWELDCCLEQIDAASASGGLPADSAMVLARRLLDLYRGAFLLGEPEHAVLVRQRDRLRSRFLRAVSLLGETLEGQKSWPEAATLYQRALEQDNLAESLYRRLMHCHAQLGQAAEAVAVYRRCRDALSIIAGLQPGPQTIAQFESLQDSARTGGIFAIRT